MNRSRRDVLLAGLAALALPGCATGTGLSRGKNDRPGPIWPEDLKRPTPAPGSDADLRPVRPAPSPANVFAAAAVPGVIRRAAWTSAGLASRDIDVMNGVNRLTIHHDGMEPVRLRAPRDTYARLEQIRTHHTKRRGWSDIGYHYAIDPAGRVLEGRSVVYQGAHVADHNPHNLGVLVLGNFELQKPGSPQLTALANFVKLMRRTHRIPAHAVRTHQELNPTQCPGQHLQSQVVRLRGRKAFG
ncbi:MAG: peptidoglycan recognition family protein [Planctomycetota bacterium]